MKNGIFAHFKAVHSVIVNKVRNLQCENTYAFELTKWTLLAFDLANGLFQIPLQMKC